MSQNLTNEIRAKLKAQLTAVPAPERKEIHKHTHRTGGGVLRKPGSLWPYKSDALGVHPDQIPEAKDWLARNGVGCDFDSEGRAIVTCETQRKAICKATGLFNGRDGYGIPKDERPVDKEKMANFLGLTT